MLKIEKSPRSINKFSLYSAIVSAAALILVLIYVQVAPPPSSSVATITDSVNAQWAQSKHPTDIGSELWDDGVSRWLHKGIVKIEFDYGAEVIIEGPAEFALESADEIILHSGRLYASVPGRATGFTVQTPCSTVIDLGTEFGVKVDVDGTTDVHLAKGRVSLVPGAAGQKGKSHDLVTGDAKRVNRTGKLRDIEFDPLVFTRHLPSPYEVAVRASQPMAYWRFEDDLSELAMNSVDKSRYNGVFFGNCRLEDIGPDLGDGESHTALILDGQDSCVKFENVIQDGVNNCTLLLWVKPDSDEAQNIVVCSGPNGADYDFSMQFRIGLKKKFEFYTLSETYKPGGSKGKFTLHADDTVQLDRWYFLAATIDGRKVSLYIDGELADSTIMNDELFDNYPDMYIGGPAGNKRNYPEHKMGAFRGMIDEVAIFDHTLSNKEIRDLYRNMRI